VAESDVFDWVSTELERRTSLSRLEARGTVRLLLKDLGLDPTTVSAHQMAVVIERLLAPALSKRKVQDAAELCLQISLDLADRMHQQPDRHRDSAYDVFERFDSDATRRLKK
jgi:hypothetical protein